jgi:hypothetical protein
MILGNTPTVALSFIKFCINLPPFGFRPRFFIEVVALVALVAVAYSVVVTLSTLIVFGSSVFLFGFFFFCAATVSVAAAAATVAAATVSVVTVSVVTVSVAVVAAGLGLAARFFEVDFISGAGAAVSLTAVAAFLTLDGIVEKNIKIKQQKWLFIIHRVCQTF